MRILFIICLLFSAVAARAEIAGPARIIDGDTLQVGATRIRLEGIDAPEADQTCVSAQGVTFGCGMVASQALSGLVGDGPVACSAVGRDTYGRTVARCMVAGGDLGQAMVAAGHAVAYRAYSLDYVPAEEAARRGGRGFWSAQMEDPADYRAARAERSDGAADCAIKGNISDGGRIYHLPGQDHYAATRISTARGERWFCTEAEARAAGWRAARR